MIYRDIDIVLFRLIKKYDIYKYIPEVEAVYSKLLSWELINEQLESIPEGKVVALRGGGAYTDKFLNCLSDVARKKIKYIIDKNLAVNISGVEIVHPAQIEECHIDIVIVSSWKYKAEFVSELLDVPNIQIIDPYDYLDVFGIHYSNEIFIDEKYPHMHMTYLDVNNTLGLYNREKDETLRIYYLEKLIAQCIEIKDFINAEKYIKDYIEGGYDKENRYAGFLKEFAKLVSEIEDEIVKRNQKDIIINWIDNVNAEEFYSTEFVKKRREDSCVFGQAYTVTPWTHFTMDTIFTGKVAIDDELFLLSNITEENSPVLKYLKDFGYNFCYVANPGMYQKMFDRSKLVSYPQCFNEVILDSRAVSECSTRLQWISLKMRLQSEKPVCHLIHNLAETHIPFIFTGISSVSGDRFEDRLKYRKEGMNFVAEQLEWYGKYYGKNSCQIYLADHGEGMEYGRAYESGRTKIPFIVKGKGVKVGQEGRLYSHRNFAKIIYAILTENIADWDACFDDYVLYQNLDFYNEKAIHEHILRWLKGLSSVDMANIQIRGIRTREDMYVRYAMGKELYFRLPNEETNLIENEMWERRIEELRELCGDNFIDISKETLFEHSRLIYDYLEMLSEDSVFW